MGSAFILFKINLFLSILCLVPIPFLILIIIVFVKKSEIKFQKALEKESDIIKYVQQSLEGVRVIKAFTKENQHKRNFCIVCDDHMKCNMDMMKDWAINSTLFSFSLVI